MVAAVWQRRWAIAGIVGVSIIGSYVLLSALPERYQAQSVIALDRASNHAATFDTPLSSLVVDSETVASEIELIYSRDLIGEVVRQTDLLATEEYGESQSEAPGILGKLVQDVKAWIKQISAAEDTSSPAPDPIAGAVDQFRNNVDIQRKGISRAIVISFDSEDPERASTVANALAQRYIDDQVLLQQSQEELASEQLQAQIDLVRGRLRETEVAIEEQRQRLGQVTGNDLSKVEQRLAGLNTQLVNADAELAEARAEVAQARTLRETPAAIESMPSTLASSAVARLRERQFDIQSKLSELATKYGSKHPLVRQAENQLAQNQNSMQVEIEKTISALRSRANIAAGRKRSIENQMAALETQESATNPVKATLVGLQREAGSYRDRIGFLEKRFGDISQVNSLANLKPFARIISAAEVPVAAAFPNKKLLLPLIALLALMACLAGILGRFLFRHQLRSRLPVLPDGAAYIASLPQSANKALANIGPRTKVSNPHTAALLDAALTALPAHAPRTFLVTALSDDADGLRTARQLATASAARDRRTLLIDLHLHGVKEKPGRILHDAAGTVAVLRGQAGLDQAVITNERVPLDTLEPEISASDSARLLSGERLRDCLGAWASRYDTIVLAAPPVLDSPDAALAGRVCGLSLVVAGQAELLHGRGSLERALQRLGSNQSRLIGVIVDGLDERLFSSDDFDYHRSEHYLARLAPAPVRTDTRLPALPDSSVARNRREAKLSNIVRLRRRHRPEHIGRPPEVHGEAWLLQQAPERFTIRLSTPPAPRDAGQSLAYLAERLPLAWYSRGTENQRIPVMLVGLFDTPAELRAVLESEALAPIADRAEPCTLSVVHAEIVQHRRSHSDDVNDIGHRASCGTPFNRHTGGHGSMSGFAHAADDDNGNTRTESDRTAAHQRDLA